MVGGKADDLIYGDDGADLVYGNLGNDTCFGGAGADTIRGGQGNDTLQGGTGNDFISGDRGDDTLTGGIGADIFHGSQDAGVDRVLGPLCLSARMPMLKAMTLVTRREAGEGALGGKAPSGRNLFLVPWRDCALFGTWESERTCAPDAIGVTEAEIAAFVAELNQAFPSLDLKRADVTMVHRGIVPAVAHADGRATLQGHEQLRDHAGDGVDGLITIAGTKYTTARSVAERITNLLLVKLKQPAVHCRTALTPLPGGGLRDVRPPSRTPGVNMIRGCPRIRSPRSPRADPISRRARSAEDIPMADARGGSVAGHRCRWCGRCAEDGDDAA